MVEVMLCWLAIESERVSDLPANFSSRSLSAAQHAKLFKFTWFFRRSWMASQLDNDLMFFSTVTASSFQLSTAIQLTTAVQYVYLNPALTCSLSSVTCGRAVLVWVIFFSLLISGRFWSWCLVSMRKFQQVLIATPCWRRWIPFISTTFRIRRHFTVLSHQ